MPFRKIKVKDPKTNKDKLDKNGEPIYVDEKFLPYFLGNTKEAADKLYKTYASVLSHLARKYAMYNSASEEDLIQEGAIGLARAVRDFDESRSENFNIFAMYKIKDSMREFVAKQGNNVHIPQYIKEATRLILKLTELLNKVSPAKERDFESIWVDSKIYDDESEIIKNINNVRDSLMSLAHRSGTTVDQLLERAELYPSDTTGLEDIYVVGDLRSTISSELVENDMVAQLTARKSIDKLKEVLTEDDFNLLYAHYVDGMTVRQLEPIIGIKAASITVKIHTILKSIQKKKDQILM